MRARLFEGDSNPQAEIHHRLLVQLFALTDDELLHAELEWLVATLLASVAVEPVVLGSPYRDEPIEQSVPYTNFRGERGIAPGLKHVIHYPISGSAPLLNASTSIWFGTKPTGYVHNGEVIFEYAFPGFEHGDKLSREHKDNFELFNKYLAIANSDLKNFLQRLPDLLSQKIIGRKNEIESKRSSANALNIPIGRPKEPMDGPAKMLAPRVPIPIPQKRNHESPVSRGEFLGIVGVVEIAARHWERHPRLTDRWDEGNYRDLITSYLNLTYAKFGSVTAETFIKRGKSDIVIRDADFDVFIAECKIWRGPKSADMALDQLFDRYVTWRASYVALIVFNKTGKMTSVGTELDSVAKNHACFVRSLGNNTVTRKHFVFHHPTDRAREFELAILAYPIS